MKSSDHLEIERFGGLAGIGLPGSRIRSRTELAGSDLTSEERESVRALFEKLQNTVPPVQAGADRFHYRLTLRSGNDHRQIDVGEADLMPSLQERLQDELI